MEQFTDKYSNLREYKATIFGRIYTARNVHDDRLVAIKEDTRSKRSAEPELHAKLGKHPHIVEFLDSFSDKRRSFIAMEFCRFGSLKDLIDEQGTLPLRCVQHIFKQIVSSLEHIHSNKLLYRNLEPYHVLVNDIHDNGDMFVKLCDFGATRPIQNEKLGLLQTSIDFKALGSLLFFMITGSAFINTPEVYERLASFSESSADLIRGLLECGSEFGFNDIKSHPFYTFEFKGEESFCKESLDQLYESLVENEEEDGEIQSEEEEEDKENEEKTRSFGAPVREGKEEDPPLSFAEENEPIAVPQVSPIQQVNNVTVDSAYNSGVETTQQEDRKKQSIFSRFFAMLRAWCGLN